MIKKMSPLGSEIGRPRVLQRLPKESSVANATYNLILYAYFRTYRYSTVLYTLPVCGSRTSASVMFSDSVRVTVCSGDMHVPEQTNARAAMPAIRR